METVIAACAATVPMRPSLAPCAGCSSGCLGLVRWLGARPLGPVSQAGAPTNKRDPTTLQLKDDRKVGARRDRLDLHRLYALGRS
jgi:hypothetical protein